MSEGLATVEATPAIPAVGGAVALDAPAIPAAEGQLQEAPAESEFKFVLPTGEKFRTEAELIAAQIEAKYTIRELRNTNALLAANRNAEPPTPQADPAKQFITAKTQRLVDKGFEPAAAKVLAEDAWEDHKALRGEVTQTQQEARHEAFILSNPILATELADQVAQDYGRRTGRYPSDPATHLDLVLAHYARNGMEIPAQYKTGGSSMAPGARTILPGNVQGVLDRAAQQRRDQFTNPVGSQSTATAAAPSNVEQSIQNWIKKNGGPARVSEAQISNMRERLTNDYNAKYGAVR
jgi:hypothetical protein